MNTLLQPHNTTMLTLYNDLQNYICSFLHATDVKELSYVHSSFSKILQYLRNVVVDLQYVNVTKMIRLMTTAKQLNHVEFLGSYRHTVEGVMCDCDYINFSQLVPHLPLSVTSLHLENLILDDLSVLGEQSLPNLKYLKLKNCMIGTGKNFFDKPFRSLQTLIIICYASYGHHRSIVFNDPFDDILELFSNNVPPTLTTLHVWNTNLNLSSTAAANLMNQIPDTVKNVHILVINPRLFGTPKEEEFKKLRHRRIENLIVRNGILQIGGDGLD